MEGDAAEAPVQSPYQENAATAPVSLTHLNDAQREAVTSEKNYVEVLAGPGSGKVRIDFLPYRGIFKHVYPI
jgi:hypothetical protein